MHLSTELFKTMAGIDLVHVAYKGSAPALQDLLGGQIQVMIVNLLTSQPSIEAGKLRLLAVTPAKRLVNLPDVPTIAEAGVPGYAYQSWFGMVVPAKTSPDIIARLHDETVATLAEPEIRARLIAQGGVEPVGGTPAEFAATIQADLVSYADLVKRTGAHVD